MGSAKLKGVMKRADELTSDEKLELASYLIDRARQSDDTQHRRRWAALRGAVQYPMLGEDAQAWVSRTRQESEREVGLGKLPE